MHLSTARSLSRSQRPREPPKNEIPEMEYVFEDDAKSQKVLLGKGSFATVYLVRQKGTRKPFALKVVT